MSGNGVDQTRFRNTVPASNWFGSEMMHPTDPGLSRVSHFVSSDVLLFHFLLSQVEGEIRQTSRRLTAETAPNKRDWGQNTVLYYHVQLNGWLA